MPRKANTANALNSIPGPSSRVKTMLVWGRNNTQNLYSIYSSSYQMRTRIIAYLVRPVNSWNYRFPRKYQKTRNIIRFVLVKNRKWNRWSNEGRCYKNPSLATKCMSYEDLNPNLNSFSKDIKPINFCSSSTCNCSSVSQAFSSYYLFFWE